MKTALGRTLFLASSMAALAAAAGPAMAQQAGAPARPSDTATVQEIVVTAQRQAQSLLSVPMSISASTGDQLERAGIRDLGQLQFTTPGYVPSYSSGYTQVYIRGIGNSIFVGADPSVATFVDDVPRIYGSMVENFVDVERVEVLKGAQGGLYGRNATGGVVNIITHQPDTDGFHGQARVSYGEKGTARAAAYANMPINKQVAFSLAFDRETHDNYDKNIARTNPYTPGMFLTPSLFGGPAATAAVLNSAVQPKPGYADQDFWAFESKLLVKPTDNLKITFAGDFAKKRDTNGNQIFAGEPGYVQAFATGFLSSFGAFDPATGQQTPLVVQFPAGFFQGHNGDFTLEKSLPAFTNLTDYGGSMTVVWSLPHVDLTSISAYRAQQTDFFEDLVASPVPLIDVRVQNQKWFLYQELRAISTDTGRWHYLAGATYLSNNFHGENHTRLLGLINEPSTHVLDAVRNWSVYAQVGYDLTDKVNLTVSGRYVHETNSADFTDPVVSSASMKETKFLPSATLSYKLDGGGNVYARWAKGFKAGGVNPIAPPIVFEVTHSPGSTFAPEIVDTYEIGYRAPLFDRTVQVTAAAFYNDYRDLQVAAHSTPQHPEIFLAIVNAGSARTYGAEGSVTWRVNRAVTLGANVGYLDAKYKTFAIHDPGHVLADFDVSGETMTNSPTWQLSFSGDLDQPINDQFRLVGSMLVSHLSDITFLQSALPGVLPEPSQPGYWLANARLGVRTTDDRYGLSIFANNLFNRGYVTYGSSSGLGNQLTWGAPRIVGAEVSAKF